MSPEPKRLNWRQNKAVESGKKVACRRHAVAEDCCDKINSSEQTSYEPQDRLIAGRESKTDHTMRAAAEHIDSLVEPFEVQQDTTIATPPVPNQLQEVECLVAEMQELLGSKSNTVESPPDPPYQRRPPPRPPVLKSHNFTAPQRGNLTRYAFHQSNDTLNASRYVQTFAGTGTFSTDLERGGYRFDTINTYDGTIGIMPLIKVDDVLDHDTRTQAVFWMNRALIADNTTMVLQADIYDSYTKSYAPHGVVTLEKAELIQLILKMFKVQANADGPYAKDPAMCCLAWRGHPTGAEQFSAGRQENVKAYKAAERLPDYQPPSEMDVLNDVFDDFDEDISVNALITKGHLYHGRRLFLFKNPFAPACGCA